MQHDRTAPSRRWRRAALAVPPLMAIACTLFCVYLPLTNGHVHHESVACRWIPLPWSFWVISYGGLSAALGSVALWLGLWRHARTHRWDPGAAWQGRLATGFAALGVLAVPALVVAVVLTHLESAEIAAKLGRPMCEGLGW